MSNAKHKIASLPKKDRPAEKLLTLNPQNLSNSELLSILIGTGTSKWNSLELSRIILSSFHDQLSRLTKCQVKELMKYHGIGFSKASVIVAFAELSRRRAAELVLVSPYISWSKDAAAYLVPLLGDYRHEVFGALFLNAASRIIDFKILFEGGVTGVVADVRIIMKQALIHHAVKLVVCHNHPSGSTTPSHADEELTRQLNKATKLLDITLMDHIIVGGNDYYSFSKAGKLG